MAFLPSRQGRVVPSMVGRAKGAKRANVRPNDLIQNCDDSANSRARTELKRESDTQQKAAAKRASANRTENVGGADIKQ